MRFVLAAGSTRRGWWGCLLLAALLPCAVFAQAAPQSAVAAVVALDVGADNACAVRNDGRLVCWGSQAGGISLPPASLPVLRVALGDGHGCALNADGRIGCWGRAGAASQPPAASGRFVALSAGNTDSCAIDELGQIVCWGDRLAGRAPAGRHLDLSVGDGHACAVAENGALACWSASTLTPLTPPSGAARYLSVVTGDGHACALRSDGAAQCWGGNAHGQITPPDTRFVMLSAGSGFSCGLRDNGMLACWGQNTLSQTDTPAGRYTAVASGRRHSCARADDGGVRCWGGQNLQQEHDVPGGVDLTAAEVGGRGACALNANGKAVCRSQGDMPLPPHDVVFQQISLGRRNGCGLREDGTALCWGESMGPVPADVFTRIDVGDGHACAIRPNETMICWGDNSRGQAEYPPFMLTGAIALGDRSTCAVRNDSYLSCWGEGAVVDRQPYLSDVRNASIGGENACAIRIDTGRIFCWGADEWTWTPPAGSWTAVATGDHHACALNAEGAIACWGDDSRGQTQAPAGAGYTGLSAIGDRSCAVHPQGMVCWGDLALELPSAPLRAGRGAIAAAGAHTCNLRSDGGLACWGDGSFGQLAAPAIRAGALAAAADHACAIGVSGALACWGDNGYGASTPVDAPARDVDVGQFNACATRSDGGGACWGWNVNGQSTPPAGAFRKIATGLNHSCGLREDGLLQCWGYNGDGQSSPPAGVFKSVDVGERHSCALAVGGALHCWGLGSEGQTSPPAGVFRMLAAGDFHNCAVRSDGRLACWGRNQAGQATPPATAGFVAVSASRAHSCAIRDDGARLCWGEDALGQAPRPALSPATLPVAERGGFYDQSLALVSASGYAAQSPRFRIVAGRLPPGLNLDADGRLSGEPTRRGATDVTIEAVDANGLRAVAEYRLQVLGQPDTTPPEVLAELRGTNGPRYEWFDTDVHLRWIVEDPESEATTSGCGQVLVQQDTAGTDVTCVATSEGGATSETVTIRRDTIAPETMFLETPPTDDNYGTAPSRFVFGATDANLDGVVFECTTHPHILDSFTECPSSLTVFMGTDGPWGAPIPGTFTMHVRARDAAGNRDPTVAIHTWTILRDTTPPELVPNITGTLGDNGWYISDVSLRWWVSDPQTPIVLRSQCLDADLTIDGSMGQYCNARSWGGLSQKSLWLGRDTTPPTAIAWAQNPPNAAGWYRGDVTAWFSCQDAISGIASCPPPQTLTGEGDAVSIVPRSARDNAGHLSAPAAFAAKIDRTAPTLTDSLSTQPNVRGWHRSDVTVQFHCADALSGLAGPCPQAVVVSNEGAPTRTVRDIADRAGNGTAVTVDLNLDKTPPNISDVLVRYSCYDALSGIAAGSCPPPRTLSSEGADVRTIASVSDNADWTSSIAFSARIDKTPPFMSMLPVPAELTLNAAPPSVNPIVSDALSGVASVACTPIDTRSVGQKTVVCSATDVAGNTVSNSRTYRVVYAFTALSAPLNAPAQMFELRAPRSLALEWRLADANGAAVTNATVSAIQATAASCQADSVALTAPPAGESDRFENFGDGRYRQTLWLPSDGSTQCKRLQITLNDGFSYSALVKIVPRTQVTGGRNLPVSQTQGASNGKPTQSAPVQGRPSQGRPAQTRSTPPPVRPAATPRRSQQAAAPVREAAQPSAPQAQRRQR
jgi:alpha-tubulin suppressor-like RCC1 family protein